MSALPSTKVDEDEIEFSPLELIETTYQEEISALDEATPIQGRITISF